MVVFCHFFSLLSIYLVFFFIVVCCFLDCVSVCGQWYGTHELRCLLRRCCLLCFSFVGYDVCFDFVVLVRGFSSFHLAK